MSPKPDMGSPLPEDLLALLRTVTTRMSDLFLGVNREGFVRYVSANSQRLLGYTQDELIGTSALIHVHPEDLPGATERLTSVLTKGTPFTYPMRLCDKSGVYSWWEVSGSPYTVASEERTFLVARDIDDKLKAYAALEASEQMIRRLYEIASDTDESFSDKLQAILLLGCERFDLESAMMYRSDGSGFTALARFGSAVRESDDLPRDRTEFLAKVICAASALSSGPGESPRYLGAAVRVGGLPWGVLHFYGTHDRADGYSSSDRDIVSLMALLVGSEIERQEAETSLRRLALHDPLTDLPNRRLLDDRIDASMMMCQRFRTSCALLFVDLDHFKAINDDFGHARGDEALREASRRLNAQVRNIDTLARVGGDEFVVLLPQTDGAGAQIVADRILVALRKPLAIGPTTSCIGASIGIAVYRGGGESVDQFIERADSAMYSVKAGGRDGYSLSA